MMLLDISTKKYPNTHVKLDDKVYRLLKTFKSKNGATKKWRCHSGSKGDIMVVTTICSRERKPQTISLAWVAHNYREKKVHIDLDNIHLWGRPIPRDARIMYRNRDPLDLRKNNLVETKKGQPLPNREPLTIPSSLPFGKREEYVKNHR